uniref:CLIP domain-containing serine protease n=1 Tax=Anopheles dirus TaxID=7168 RepID=A0A182N579_9DIPT
MYHRRPLVSMLSVCCVALGLLSTSVFGGKHTFRQLCITQDQQRGRCVPVKQCDGVLRTLRKESLTNEDIQFVYGTECGRTPEGKALVCCTQSSLVPVEPEESETEATEVVRVSGDVYLPAAEPTPVRCGVQSTLKLEQTNQSLGHHPWSVLLHYGPRGNDRGFNCSGSLISAEYVLTSASCVDDADTWDTLMVRLGEWDLESAVDCILAPDSDDLVCAEPAYDVPVARVILHDSYGGRWNDIALLKLSRPVVFNKWVTPICLPASSVTVETAALSAAHWNLNTCDFSASRFKLLSAYRALNQTYCQRYVSPVAGVHYNFVCAESSEETAGDAGGGLVSVRTIDNDRQPVHELVGVLSSLTNCANFNGVSVYTKIGQYLEWIENKQKAQ